MLKLTARLLTNCSNTLRTNARENITKARAKRKAGYFIVAHPAQRMDQERPARKLLDWKPMGTRPVGRTRQRW